MAMGEESMMVMCARVAAVETERSRRIADTPWRVELSGLGVGLNVRDERKGDVKTPWFLSKC